MFFRPYVDSGRQSLLAFSASADDFGRTEADALREEHVHFVGTSRFNSSIQFCTNTTLVVADAGRCTMRNRPSRATS